MIPANAPMEHVVARPSKTANTVVNIARKLKEPE
jgi:hypothetical protein